MRVVIADDQLLIREGLTKVLAGCGIDVPATAGTVSGLMDAIDAHHPDAAIVDIRMPPDFAGEGLRAAERLQVTHPELAVLILSQYAEPAYAAALLADSPGRRGYLLKDSADVDLVRAVHAVCKGVPFFSPEISQVLLEDYMRSLQQKSLQDSYELLTDREKEVLKLVAAGKMSKVIAFELGISVNTVEVHRSRIIKKLGAQSVADVVRIALVTGFAKEPEGRKAG